MTPISELIKTIRPNHERLFHVDMVANKCAQEQSYGEDQCWKDGNARNEERKSEKEEIERQRETYAIS